MNFTKFALSDLLACTISSVCFFSLYYYYGETVIDYIKQGNMVVFGLVLILVGIFWYKNKRVT